MPTPKRFQPCRAHDAQALCAIWRKTRSGLCVPREPQMQFVGWRGAKRYPSISCTDRMGIAALHPSYGCQSSLLRAPSPCRRKSGSGPVGRITPQALSAIWRITRSGLCALRELQMQFVGWRGAKRYPSISCTDRMGIAALHPSHGCQSSFLRAPSPCRRKSGSGPVGRITPQALSAIWRITRSGLCALRELQVQFVGWRGANRYPSVPCTDRMGIAALNPSYGCQSSLLREPSPCPRRSGSRR